MTSSKLRAAAMGAAVAALSSSFASPASAAPSTCHVLLAGPTPSAEVDLDADGSRDVRVPSVTNVTLCAGADVVLTDTPEIEREQCGGFGSCMAYYVDYGMSGYAETGVTLCYTADGMETCIATDLPRVPLDVLQPGTMCIGYDLRGGFPCPNGGPIDFG
ncbi:MAG TPA: hypothetical protein VG318_04915 [Actinomycetota bacterium]|nr:hypothetical protein [Actinomycetota bacterium]